MKQNKLSLFLVTLASGFLLCQNAGAYSTWMEEVTYGASGRLGDPATGQGNFWFNAIGSVYVTNTGSLNGLTNGLVISFGDRIIIYPTNDYNHAPYAKWGNVGQYNPGSAGYPSAGTNLYFSFLYKFDDSGTPLDSVGQRVVQMERQNSGLTSAGNVSPFLLHARQAGSNIINLGVSKYSASGAPALTNWSTTNLHYGQTFFVVCKLAMCGNGHTPYESNAIWINPTTNYFNVSEPPAGASASVADGSDDTGPTGPGRFFINSSGLSGEIDEIRVGNFWPDVTPQAGQCLVPVFSASPGNLTNGAVNITNVEEESLSFSVMTVATGPAYSWQISQNSGTTWTTIPGEFDATYQTPNLWIATDQGNQYRAICYSSCNGLYATSAVATVTLQTPVSTPVGLIMYDNFSDTQRNNLPVTTNNSVWYTAVSANLDSSSGFLIGTPLSLSSSLWWGQFVNESTTNLPVHLDINRAIRVTLPFTPNGFGFHTTNGALRFGLFDYADGGVLLTNDSSLATGSSGNGASVRGYMLSVDFGPTFTADSPLSLYARSGILDNSLMGTTDDYTSMGSGPAGGGYSNAPAFRAGTNYTLVFQAARTATNSVTVAVSISGGGTNWSYTATETNYAYHRFDVFAIRPNSLETSAGGFTFPNFKVELMSTPSVTALPASDLTPGAAILNGTVNPNGVATGVWFEWGTTTNYGNTTTLTNVGSGMSDLSVSAPISGLVPLTTYHFRVVATNSSGTYYGGDETLVTAAQSGGAPPWVTTGSMSTARQYHTATLLPNGHVLVAGGNCNSGATNSAELYDPVSGTWTNTGSMSDTRYTHTATLLPNGKVLVAGGADVNSDVLASAELYDPANGTWTNTGSMNTKHLDHTATLLPGGKVLVAAGYNNDSKWLASAELYDPASGTWTNTGSLNASRTFHTATLLPNGMVLVVGGYGPSGGWLASAELYDPASGTWTYTGSLNTGRCSHTATLLPNGQVLVAGGSMSANSISSAELYDPASGTWTNTGSMNTARWSHTATLLLNGQVLVAAGYNSESGNHLASVELYNPASGMWTTTNSLNFARDNHTATLLANGQVLVAGGEGDSGILASTELYLLAPTITSQLASQSVLPGTNVTFSVSATGYEPLNYQWRLNGNNIPGATNSTFSIANVQPTDGGSYDVLVANSFGAVASLIATLKVTTAPLPFADNFADRGSTNGLSGVGSGSNADATRETGETNHAGKFGNHSVWLQWTAPANGVATFNTRGSSFDTLLAVYTGTSLSALTVVAANDDEVSGLFTSQVQFNAAADTSYIIAVDGLGSANGDIVLSWNLVTNVPQIPMIVTQPPDLTVSPGRNATFSVSATCNTSLTYQWYFNDSLAISNATNPSLTVSNVGLSQVGLYRVKVTSAAGTNVVSEEGSLEIGPAGVHSFDKLEDLLAILLGEEGFAGLGGKSFPADLNWGFPSVAAGSMDHQDISTYNATTDQGEPIPNGTGGATRWYLLTATDNSTFMLDTMGSVISNVLAVYYCGPMSSLNSNKVASDTNKNSAPDGTNCMVRFPGKAGTNYLIAVAPAVNGVQGLINLDWHVGIPPSVGGAGQTQAVGNGTTLVLQGGDNNAVPAPTYRWLWNGTNIPGATNAKYTNSNIQYYQGGTYSVVVSNFMGVVTNPIALVSVDAPLKLDVSALPAHVRIWGSATQTVVLLSSTNLTSWQPLYTNQNPLLWINYLDTDSINRDKGFYWLKRWP